MTKTQRLRNAAEGFMGGLVLAGFTGPFKWAHHQWEGPFLRAWNAWAPGEDAKTFPTFIVGGGAGRTSQPRDMLWQLKSTSPFNGHDDGPLNTEPRGMPVEEYLGLWVEGATPEQWRDLAAAFLREMEALGYSV